MIATLLHRGEDRPLAPAKPRYHAPMVRISDDRKRWALLFAVTFAVCTAAALYFGGAGSGIYDVVTQVHYHVPFAGTYSLKETWDGSIDELRRHLWRNGGIAVLAALIVGVWRVHPEKYLYAKYNAVDTILIALGVPNPERWIGADVRQAMVARGEIEYDDTTFRPPIKRLNKVQVIVAPVVAAISSVVLIAVIYHFYGVLRGYWGLLPQLGIPKANPNLDVQDKVTAIATADWQIKLLFFVPVLWSTRFLIPGYLSFQMWKVNCTIGRRVRRLARKDRPVSALSDNPPWWWIVPPWRTAYRYYADPVRAGTVAAPLPMGRRAAYWFFGILLVVTVLTIFGHAWIWTH